MLTEEQRKLVEDNERLIYGFIRLYHLDIDDWYGECALALCNASQIYDSSRGVKFSVLAYRCMKNAMLKPIQLSKYKKRQGTTITFSEELDYINGMQVKDFSHESNFKLDINKFANRYCTDIEKQIINMIQNDMSMREISLILNGTDNPKKIYNQLRNIRNKWNRYFNI